MIMLAAIKYDGKIYLGKRHNNIIHKFAAEGVSKGEQGFLTDTCVFVDREEAAKIALEAGQIKKTKTWLYSEDIY